MNNIGISDWISIICSAIALLVTIVIAILQMRQSGRMAKFEKRQDERDERRYAEGVKAQAVAFISKYYHDRGLIPLCVIAAMYNDLYYYSREIYRDFCCMTLEVQNRVLEYCNLDLQVTDEKKFYIKCIEALEKACKKYLPEDKYIFYDVGKYILYSLEKYGDNKIPNQEFEYENHLTDVLSKAFRDRDISAKPIEQLCAEYHFASCPEINACQLATTIAEFIAVYGHEHTESEKYYGSPGGYDGETIDTMEDLFLLAMFEIYVCLILSEEK